MILIRYRELKMAASNLTKEQEDKITNLVGITGADTSVARQFLEVSMRNSYIKS